MTLRSIPPMRALALAIATVAIAAAGCSSDDEGTPEACLVPADAYAEALHDAPGAVTLADGTPISSCLTSGQDPAELAQVGKAMIDTATRLNADARRDPGGEENVALGYLVAAAHKGAEQTGGIHADLVRRLDAAARFSPGGEPLSGSFERAYSRGFTSGRASG
jgi:hypothetical protein